MKMKKEYFYVELDYSGEEIYHAVFYADIPDDRTKQKNVIIGVGETLDKAKRDALHNYIEKVYIGEADVYKNDETDDRKLKKIVNLMVVE